MTTTITKTERMFLAINHLLIFPSQVKPLQKLQRSKKALNLLLKQINRSDYTIP